MMTPRQRANKVATLFAPAKPVTNKAMAAYAKVRSTYGYNYRPSANQGKFGQRPGAFAYATHRNF